MPDEPVPKTPAHRRKSCSIRRGPPHPIDVRLEGETVWLSQNQMADLFQTSKQNVSLHIRNVFDERELQEAATVKEYLTVQTEGAEASPAPSPTTISTSSSRRLSREKSPGHPVPHLGHQRLREYLVKGFTLDDQRLAEGGQPSRYFDELLERVRAIRASERMFWQKVTDIYRRTGRRITETLKSPPAPSAADCWNSMEI